MPNTVKRKIHQCTCKSCRLHPYSKVAKHHQAINRVLLDLNEKNKRQFVGLLANQHGRGGISQLSEITGLSRVTIARGCRELAHSNQARLAGIRRAGGGRLLIEKNNPAF